MADEPRDPWSPVLERELLRPAGNEPIPLSSGLMYLVGGTVILAVGLGDAALGAILFGLLFIALGVALTLTTLRAAANREPRQARGATGEVEAFTRSPMRILTDLVLAPLGGILFLGLGVVTVIGLPVFWFFGIFMLLGATATMRRGVRRTVVRIGPDGIWTPELPRRLGWDEIERLELEEVVGSAGDDGLVEYGRLGIWPRDHDLAEHARGRWALGLARGFTAFVNDLRPDSPRFSGPAAPFGIQAFDLEQDFDQLIRSVERYASVTRP
jgi:hypothetical protein